MLVRGPPVFDRITEPATGRHRCVHFSGAHLDVAASRRANAFEIGRGMPTRELKKHGLSEAD